MPLRFNAAWRFTPPSDGRFRNSSMPKSALEECINMIMKVAAQGGSGIEHSILEHFKKFFCRACGTTYVSSSNASWAESDLRHHARQASLNAPLFIDAFFDACKSCVYGDIFAPDADIINIMLSKHDVGFEIRPPHLILREAEAPLVVVTKAPPILAESAIEVIEESLRRSEKLLSDGQCRESVQETLWVLETVSTAFRGLDTATNTVGGKYFNKIIKELRHSNQGSTFECILKWMINMHGYLSSPTGGGVRHGLDLNAGVAISGNEAHLLCNLIRSYISFLLVEHERLAKG